MEIGTGIAIAGVWIFAAVNSAAKTTSSAGVYLSIIVACAVTYYLK